MKKDVIRYIYANNSHLVFCDFKLIFCIKDKTLHNHYLQYIWIRWNRYSTSFVNSVTCI